MGSRRSSSSSQEPTDLTDEDAISIKKCLAPLVQTDIEESQIYAEAKFTLQIKPICNFLVKVMKLYPFRAQQVIDLLLERMPHKNTPALFQLIYAKLCFVIAQEVPEHEERILGCLIERICSLDVEIKVKSRKLVHHNFEDYFKEIESKLLSVREAKISMLIQQFCSYLKQRIEEQPLSQCGTRDS